MRLFKAGWAQFIISTLEPKRTLRKNPKFRMFQNLSGDKCSNVSINHTDTVIKERKVLGGKRPQAKFSYLFLSLINSIKLRKLNVRETKHCTMVHLNDCLHSD